MTQREAGSPRGYDGRGRDLSEAEVQANIDAGKPYVVRLKVERPGKTIVKDKLAVKSNLITSRLTIRF